MADILFSLIGSAIMSKPLITFFCPARRTYRYRPFYDSIAYKTATPFEIIFVGDDPPTEKMPNNFHYIRTKVKPSQCYEIGVRNASGFFVQPVSDDETFDEGYVDKLVDYIEMLDIDKVLITIRLRLMTAPPKFIMHDRGAIFDDRIVGASYAGVAPVFRKDVWTELGGIDKRFWGTLNDMDMQMRFYEKGFNPFFAPDCVIAENNFYDKERASDSLLKRSWDSTWEVLNKSWVKNGHFSKKRLIPVKSFSDDKILEKDQN